MSWLGMLVEGIVGNVGLFLPWKTLERPTVLLVPIGILLAAAALCALLAYWPGAVASLLLAGLLALLLALGRAAERREARRAVKGWVAD